ncbi:Uncharacterized protein dnl_53920 [Desulfonema limicola]|uniref:Uncharacterized protein n=1 Tax=Desulfonema limicola TaxID=45656 RepID=A0A975BCC5_9BACT|nr:Uncharacterized protein dnl_53920 [Desulfonema limicola]
MFFQYIIIFITKLPQVPWKIKKLCTKPVSILYNFWKFILETYI